MPKQRSKSAIAILLILAVVGMSVCYLCWIRRDSYIGDSDEESVVVSDKQEKPSRANDTSRRRKAAMRKRLEAILEGKWIRSSDDDEDDASIRSQFPGPCRVEIDTDGDGRPDRIVRTVYDDDGKVAVEEIDNDADGQADRRLVHSYDETGKLKSMSENGEKHFNAERIFDTEGNALSEKIDFQNDGETDVLVENTYDAYGDLLTREIKSRFRDDHSSFTYDEHGNLLSKKTRALPHMKGKQEITETRYIYDSDDNLIKEIVTGDESRTTMYTYDKNDNRLSKKIDNGSDGQADRSWKYRYDEMGNKTSEKLDQDGDGIFDRHWRNFYDCWE
ncbi:MAG: hypothetical protein GY854_20430 [Deltaproteobacteria bacterium]|nr:hypothetical protein [Deltaproteobacteria bacterium]